MMSFTKAVKTCFEKYVVISGRARRSELWWFALFTWGVSVLLGFIEGAVLMGLTSGLLSGLWWLVTLLVIFCLRGTEGPNRFGPDPLR